MKLKLGERYSANDTMIKLGCADIDRVVPASQKANVAKKLVDVQDGYAKELKDPWETNPNLINEAIIDGYILGRLDERNMK